MRKNLKFWLPHTNSSLYDRSLLTLAPRWLQVWKGVSCSGWRGQVTRMVTLSLGLSSPSPVCPRRFFYECFCLSVSEFSDCPLPSYLPFFPVASLVPPSFRGDSFSSILFKIIQYCYCCYNEAVRQRRDYKEKPKEAKPLTRNAKRLLLKVKRRELTN